MPEFWDPPPDFNKFLDLVGYRQNPAHHHGGRLGLIERDKSGDYVQLRKGRFGPDYFSHLLRRRLVSA